jgi:opacity protein-like surface antigen
MKQQYRITGIAITLIIIVCSTGQKVQAGELTGELMLQGIFPSGELNDRFQSNLGIGVGLNYMYNQNVGVHTSMNYLSLSRKSGMGNFAVWHWNLNGRVAHQFHNDFSAYILGGLGVYIWNTNRAWWIDFQSREGVNLGMNYGFGLNYHFGKDMEALLQFNRHGVELKDHDSRVYWNEISLGVRFLLDAHAFSH